MPPYGFGSGPFGETPFGKTNYGKLALFDRLPETYREQDQALITVLAGFQGALARQFNELRDLLDHFGDLQDPRKIQHNLLVTLAENLGLLVFDQDPDAFTRSAIEGAHQWFGIKGSVTSYEIIARTYGFDTPGGGIAIIEEAFDKNGVLFYGNVVPPFAAPYNFGAFDDDFDVIQSGVGSVVRQTATAGIPLRITKPVFTDVGAIRTKRSTPHNRPFRTTCDSQVDSYAVPMDNLVSLMVMQSATAPGVQSTGVPSAQLRIWTFINNGGDVYIRFVDGTGAMISNLVEAGIPAGTPLRYQMFIDPRPRSGFPNGSFTYELKNPSTDLVRVGSTTFEFPIAAIGALTANELKSDGNPYWMAHGDPSNDEGAGTVDLLRVIDGGVDPIDSNWMEASINIVAPDPVPWVKAHCIVASLSPIAGVFPTTYNLDPAQVASILSRMLAKFERTKPIYVDDCLLFPSFTIEATVDWFDYYDFVAGPPPTGITGDTAHTSATPTPQAADKHVLMANCAVAGLPAGQLPDVVQALVTTSGQRQIARYLASLISTLATPVPVGVLYFKLGNVQGAEDPELTGLRGGTIFDSRGSGASIVITEDYTDPNHRKIIATCTLPAGTGTLATSPGWFEFGMFDNQDVMVGHAVFEKGTTGVIKNAGDAMTVTFTFFL